MIVFVGETVVISFPSLNNIDGLIKEKLFSTLIVFVSNFKLVIMYVNPHFFFLPPRELGSAVADAPIDARSASEPPKI